MIGYRSDRDQERIALNKRLRGMHPEIIARTEAAIADVGGTVARDPKTDLLTINDEMVVSLVLARCQPQGDGRLRWRIRFDPMRYQADVTLAVRLDPEKAGDSDMKIAFVSEGDRHLVTVRNGVLIHEKGAPEKASATITAPTAAILALLGRQATARELMAKGVMKIDGNPLALMKFAGFFEQPPTDFPLVTP